MAQEADTISARVRYARTLRGVGCRELDRLADLKTGHTAIIESRPLGGLDSETAAKIAKALDAPLAWLITGEGEGPKPNAAAETTSGAA